MWQSHAFRLYVGSMLLTTISVLLVLVADASGAIGAPESTPVSAEIELIAVETPAHLVTPSPPINETIIGAVLTLEVSGYTSTVEQTDSRPCEAADQSDICERKRRGELICASSRNIPLGARLHVEGLGTCTVADRMNTRYTNHVDWYCGKDTEGDDILYQCAKRIGRRDRVVTIVSVPE